MYPVPSNVRHQPWMNHVVRLYEPAIKLGRYASNKAHRQRGVGPNRQWNRIATRVYRQQVLIASEQVNAVQVEIPDIEIEIAASAVVGLSRAQDGTRTV